MVRLLLAHIFFFLEEGGRVSYGDVSMRYDGDLGWYEWSVCGGVAAC